MSLLGHRSSKKGELMVVYEEKPRNYKGNRGFNEMEGLTPWWLSLALFLFGWLGLNLIAVIVETIVVAAIGTGDPALASVIINVSTYAALTGGFLAFLVFYKKGETGKSLWRSFKNKFTWINGLSGLFFLLFASSVVGFIMSFIYPEMGDNGNEGAINTMMTLYPVPVFFMTVVMAPFCEELTYRFGLFAAARRLNTAAAFVVTILVFALIHFDLAGIIYNFDNPDLIEHAEAMRYLYNELCNIPTYAVAGGVLSYIYYRSGSCAASMVTHAANNLLGFVFGLL